jgi:hypothetical protein
MVNCFKYLVFFSVECTKLCYTSSVEIFAIQLWHRAFLAPIHTIYLWRSARRREALRLDCQLANSPTPQSNTLMLQK